MKEPVAAAIAYGLDRDSDGEERTVLVYDLGGTSLDVTVVTVEEGVFEVLGSERVEGWYGGRKMDGNVARWVLKEVAARMGRGGGRGDRDGKVGGHMQSEDIMMLDPKLVRKVKKEVAESVKVALSGQEAVEIDVGELLTNLGGMERNLTMTRRDFEDVNHVLVYDTLSAVGRVLLAANVWWNEVDDVIVVGGSGKIPMVRRVVERYFRRENMTLREGNVDPAEAVVFGAAIQAMVSEDWILGYEDVELMIIHRCSPGLSLRIARWVPLTLLRLQSALRRQEVSWYDLVPPVQDQFEMCSNCWLTDFKTRIIHRYTPIPTVSPFPPSSSPLTSWL